MKIKESIKEKLIYKLKLNGFSNRFNSKTFEKSTRRESVTYTFYSDYFEVYHRCYPAREGWTINKYKYTKENIKSITNPH